MTVLAMARPRRGLVMLVILALLAVPWLPAAGQSLAPAQPLAAAPDAWPNPVEFNVPGLQVPNGLAVNPYTNRLYVTSRNDNTVMMLDATTLAVLGKSGVGNLPFGVAVHIGSNKVYVANFGSGTLSVLRGSDLQLLTTIALNPGSQPTAVGALLGSNLIVVVLHGASQFVVIDGVTDQITHRISPGAAGAWGLAVDDAYERIFVSFRDSGAVKAFDRGLGWGSPPNGTARPCGPTPGGAPFGLAFDGVPRQLYVACAHQDQNVDTAVAYRVSTGGALAESGRIALEPGGNNGGGGIGVVPSTGHAFFTNSLSRSVSVMSAAGWRLARFPLGADPFALAVDPLTWRVYVGDRAGNRLFTFYDQSGIATCRNIRLSPPFTNPAGMNPSSVAVGDFNNDGALDAAVTNNSSWGGSAGTVSVLLGHGSGMLGVPQAYQVHRGPVAVVARDLNGDFKLDLAVANYDSGDYAHPSNVSVLLGNGNGTFGPATPYEVGYGPNALAVGDFDGNGWPDLAVTNAGVGNKVSVLLGSGGGGFAPADHYYSGIQPMDVVTADFNRDGRLDLVTANWGNPDNNGWLTLLLGAGDGKFPDRTYLDPFDKPGRLIAGDFNRDGNPDLVVADSFSSFAQVLLGRGDGTFTEAPSFQGKPAAAGDFNADGRPDLVGFSGPNAALWLGNGDGTFSVLGPFPAGEQLRNLAVGDFNGDGRPDVAVVNGTETPFTAGAVSVLLHRCTLNTCLPLLLR